MSPTLALTECVDTIEILPNQTHILEYSVGESIITGVIMPVLLTIGLLDNLAFVYVVLRLPAMRTPTNCYLVDLAVADIIFLVFAMGEKIILYVHSPLEGDVTLYGSLACVLIPLLSDISYFASLCFVTLVSFERYIAVCRPQSRNYFLRPVFTVILCGGSWAISVLLAATMIPSNYKYDTYCLTFPENTDDQDYSRFPNVYSQCLSVNILANCYALGMQTVPFLISVVFNFYMYAMIVRGLNQSIKRLRKHKGGSKKEQDTKIRDQIARMLILNGVIFFVCLAPFEVSSLLKLFRELTGVNLSREWLTLTARILSYVNSVVNPIIFTTMSQRYREAFKQVFIPKTCSRYLENETSNGPAPSTTNTYIKMTKTNIKT